MGPGMGAVPPLPVLDVPGGWQATVEAWGRRGGRLRLRRDGLDAGIGAGAEAGIRADVVVERCAAGRLREAYPAGARDVELRVGGGTALPPALLPPLLAALAEAVRRADPGCRRIVYACPEDDAGRVAAAESAGFRHVVDVELAGEQLSLLVSEPDRVRRTDMDLGHVPGS